MNNINSPINEKSFWQALGVRAVGVTIVTAQAENGPAGFLALSAAHVTARPPSMLVSIDDKTHALSAVLHSKHFAINYIADDNRALADTFAGRGALKGRDRFEVGRWRVLTSGAPVLIDAVGAIDCVLQNAFRYHNTTIVVGQVVEMFVSDRNDCLIFHRGQYRALS